MTRYFSTKSLVGFSIFTTLLLFAFSGSHPTTGSGGYTGAPNDNVCTTCHSPGGSLDGSIEFSGIPSNVMPNTTYPIIVTITDSEGSAVRAGFQMVSLKSNLANGGAFSVPASENNAQVKMAAGKSYVGHQPAKNFAANEVTYMVDWTSPATATGDITIYAAAIIANGGNGNSNDKFVTSTQSVTLGGGSTLAATFSNIIDATCSDSNDGSATVNATGGSGNYMYNWDNGETSATAVMLSGGVHDVTVTDDSNGQIIESVTIGAPDPILPTIVFQTDADCNGSSSGSAEVSATGGTPGFQYDWGNGIMGGIQTNLSAANYVVTVTDINGCSALIDVSVGEPAPIDINIINITEPSCNGDDNGSISVEATGGNGGFTYNWLDGIGAPNEGTLSLIPAGDYQVEVIDSEDCITQTTITVGEPDAVTSSVTGTDVLCFGENSGTATAAGEGGNGGFTFVWSNGLTDASISGLAAGTYFVTVSDSEACTSVSSYEIMQPSSALEAGISIINQPNCGNSDGELSAFATGGTTDYTYLWNTGATSPVLTNLESGQYTITVTDNNNCTSEFTVDLLDNDGVTLAANDVENNPCFGDALGSATISASGGTGQYSFEWSNGGTNATENNLTAGNYTITVTDEGNCTGEITIEITEPDDFEANETITDVTCNGIANGSIQVDGTGGSGALTYLWNTGETGDFIDELIPGIYSVTITDENNCTGEVEFVIEEPDPILASVVDEVPPACPGEMNGAIILDPSGGTGMLTYLWSTGDTTSSISNIAAGDYSITITDEVDCEVIFDLTLDDPAAIGGTITGVSPSCNTSQDGSVTVSIIGGTGNYDIIWNTGDTTTTVDSLSGGSYSVTVSDESGCTVSSDFILLAPPAIDPNISTTDESENGANDGTATCDPMEGVAPYDFLWSTGETTQSIMNLAPGAYSLTITDANNCETVDSFNINNGDCNISSEVEIQNISCFGLEDGSISVTLTGAVNPVTYMWSNEATTTSLDSLSPGVFEVTITDANNCQIQLVDLEIIEPDEIVASDPIITDATTAVSNDGTIDIQFSGGTGELFIQYTDGNGNPISIDNFDNLPAGSYGAIVTDENGCEQFFGPFDVGFISSTQEALAINAKVYPNPARTFFIIETESNLTENPSVFSISGQQYDVPTHKNINQYNIDTQKLPNGIYYIKLVSESTIALRKIIIAQ